MSLAVAAHAPNRTAEHPFRVMVVDDSVVMRNLISRVIAKDSQLSEVVATAANGKIAIDRVARGGIDIVILDIEMPVMDGITALPLLLGIDPNLVVIMASSLTTRNAQISLKALSAGAKDYVPKPTSMAAGIGVEEFERSLLEKIKILGHRYRRGRPGARTPSRVNGPTAPAAIPLRPVAVGRPKILAIGSSTGGPVALIRVLKDLARPIRVPILIVQHMPPTFTGLLAENITRECSLPCQEAKDSEHLRAGVVYVAPGDYHMTITPSDKGPIVKLNQSEKENFCRPAVDPTLRSLVDVYQNNLVVAILTGMGQDGLLGATAVVRAGGNVVAQDEASSVVWGMPGAVAKAGLCCAVVPLQDVGQRLSHLIGV